MPEFLSRPNLPNALAQSLVQLAAHQNDPIASGIENIGAIADKYGEDKLKKDAMEAHYAHERKMREFDRADKDAENRVTILTHLLGNDQVVKSFLNQPMTSSDAQALLYKPDQPGVGVVAPGVDLSNPRIPNPAAAGGIPSESLGLPGGFTIINKKKKDTPDTITITDEMAKNYPSLSKLQGKDILAKDYLDAVKLDEKSGGKDTDMDLARKIVESTPKSAGLSSEDKLKAIIEVHQKIKAHRNGEDVKFDAPVDKNKKKASMWSDFWGSIKSKFHGAVKESDASASSNASSSGGLPGLKVIEPDAGH